MGFQNDITGQNGALIRQQIKSPNFVTGVSGWIIKKDGTVEFNSGTFRGSIAIGNSQEVMIYSSATPAAGTLLIALAGAAGNDGFGNTFPQGLSVSAAGNQVVLGETGGSPLIYLLTGNANIQNSYGIQAITQGAGTGEYDFVQILGPQDKIMQDKVISAWHSSSPDGAVSARHTEYYSPSSGVTVSYAFVDFRGFVIEAGAITGVHPGTGTNKNNVAVAETWQTPALSANWTVTGLTNPVRYRIEPIGSGLCCRIDGEILTAGAGPWNANVTIFSLPTGYIPSKTHPFITRSDIAVAAGQCTVNILNGGGIQNGQAFTAANQRLWFDGVVFPLD